MSSKESKILALAFSVLLFLFLKYVVDQSVEALPESLQVITYVSLPIAGGLITLSFGSLLEAFSDAKNSATSHLLRRISEDSARNFSLGFLLTAYLNLIRPSLAYNVPFLPYVEWVTVALTVYVMYATTRFSVKGFSIGSEGISWKRHTHEVRRETGRDLMRITSVMEQFVNHGEKEPLLIYLALHLHRLGETEESILKKLNPLVEYREKTRMHKLYLLVFPWKKGKLAEKNRKARESLLKTLLENVNGL